MIELRNLTKKFGEKTVFSNFSEKIEDGEMVIISGVSGSGKTTLLNMMSGLENPDSGEILYDGKCKKKSREWEKFYLYQAGFLFQNFALLESETVKSNLNMVKKNARSGWSIEEVLNFVDLKGCEKQKVYQLSGGEQQRVALARLLYKKCSVIFADEPTGSLDRKNADRVMSLLTDLNKMGKTVIVVSHDEKIVNCGTRVISLDSNTVAN